jgi:hypothetical protein
VTSKTNRPSPEIPFTLIVRYRPSNSAWAATSVVAAMFTSWRTTRWPPLVNTKSGSMKSVSLVDRHLVVRESVLGQVAGRAPVGDDEGLAVGGPVVLAGERTGGKDV